jgi:hypothetical protein
LQSNNLSNPQNVLFTKQSTQELFTPQLRKITNTITDIAGKVDILRQGGGIKKKNPWVEHVKQFAKENNIGYFKALSNPKCKSTYKKEFNWENWDIDWIAGDMEVFLLREQLISPRKLIIKCPKLS